MLNRVKADMTYFTKVFNQDTIKKINENELKIADQMKEIERFAIMIENTAS